jgi:hypothetical protein
MSKRDPIRPRRASRSVWQESRTGSLANIAKRESIWSARSPCSCLADLAFRFGQDSGVTTMHWLALALWSLGDVERARSLIEGAQRRSASVTHIGTHAYEKAQAAFFELMRRDFSRVAANCLELAQLTREHELTYWRVVCLAFEGVARTARGAVGEGLEGPCQSKFSGCPVCVSLGA